MTKKGSKSGDKPLAEEVRVLKERLSRLEAEMAEKDRKLKASLSRVEELEQSVADDKGEISSLKEATAQGEAKNKKLEVELSKTVSSYKTLILSSNPHIPDDLISGQSIEDIDQSLSQAEKLVNQIKQGLKEAAKKVRIPAGAPARRAPDFSGLSSRERIKYAIGGR